MTQQVATHPFSSSELSEMSIEEIGQKIGSKEMIEFYRDMLESGEVTHPEVEALLREMVKAYDQHY